MTIEPDHRAVEAMTHMIRGAGKAYSVFDAAKLVLTSGDRFAVKFVLSPEAHAKLHTVPADGSLWLTRDEAVAHLLQSDVLQQYYKAETVELEEPKGNFTSVAICGFSGEILGPPNHHSYQTALHKLHRERFSNIPFEDYKRRVRTDNSPEAVAKWKESQKHGTYWVDLKAEVPEGGEAPRFKTRSEMEAHFRAHHASSLIGEATEATVAGNIPRKNLSPAFFNGMRHAVEEARKHLLPLAQRLCASFEHHGLKLFKRRGGKLWVSRNRPRLLDSHVALSDRIAKIVRIIKEKPGIGVKDLLAIVAPQAEAEAKAPAPVAEKAEAAPMPEPAAEASAETAAEAPAGLSSEPEAAPHAEMAAATEDGAAAVEIPAPPSAEHPDERVQALKDLHWLNSEGYIIEYSDGVVFPGVTEPPPAKPKPVKEKPQSAAKTSQPSTPSAEAAPGAPEGTETNEPSADQGEPEVSSTESSALQTGAEAEPSMNADELVAEAPASARSYREENSAEGQLREQASADPSAPAAEAQPEEPAAASEAETLPAHSRHQD